MLLLQPQAPSFVRAIIGIENFGESFRTNFLLNSPIIVTDIKGIEIK